MNPLGRAWLVVVWLVLLGLDALTGGLVLGRYGR